MNSINDDVAKRIATIEAKLSLYKKGILMLLLLFISLFVIGGKKSEVLKYDVLLVNKLILVDDNDIPKIVLVADNEFSGLIVVNDKMEKQITVGTNSTTGPSIAVYDKNERVRGALTCVKDTPGIALYRPDGKPTIAITSQSEGPGIYLYDKYLNPMVSLGSGEDGSSKLAFYDSKNIMRVAMGYGGNKPMVALFNERKELIFKAPK